MTGEDSDRRFIIALVAGCLLFAVAAAAGTYYLVRNAQTLSFYQRFKKQVKPPDIEAEFASSEYGELQALLKEKLPEDYKQVIDLVTRRRNEGASNVQAGQEAFALIQQIMRGRLKYAGNATIDLIDRVAENEIEMFRTVATQAPGECARVLGKDQGGAEPPPEQVRALLRNAALYRFQAIIDGMGRFSAHAALAPEEIEQLRVNLKAEGVASEDIESGAFLRATDGDPGKPCATVEKLLRSISRLDEKTRRKFYSNVLFSAPAQ